MQGKIVKISGFYYVHVAGSGIYECKAKKEFSATRRSNLSWVMMWKSLYWMKKKKIGNVEKILPRTRELIRPAVANIDMALVIFAAAKPI